MLVSKQLSGLGLRAGVMAALMAGAALPAFAQGTDLIVNSSVAPSTLDPAWACGLEEISFAQNFYVRLVQYGRTEPVDGVSAVDYGVVEPYLADSWEVSEDGLVYTFHLKEGFTFASGNPVDAEAVRYSLQRVLDMNGCGAFFLTDGYLNPMIYNSIEVTDPLTVTITLNYPNGNMLGDLATHAGSIVDPSVIEANGGVTAGAPSQFMSSNVAPSGPFLLESYSPNQSARLVANPDFAGDAPLSSAITVNWVSAAPTLLMQARTGQADVTLGIAKQAAVTLLENPGTRVVPYDAPFAYQMFLPNSKEPWNNPLIREAVAHAVPYEDILERVAYGYGTLFYGPVHPSVPGFDPALEPPIPFDLERARALIEESGVPTPIEVEVLIQEGDAVQQQLATILQSIWSEIGINLTVRVTPAAEFQELSQGHMAQSLMRLDGPGVLEVGYHWGYELICGIGFNLGEFCDPAVDALIGELRASSDPEVRAAKIAEVVEIWRAAYPKIQFFEDQPLVVLSDAVTSFTTSAMPEYRFWGK